MNGNDTRVPQKWLWLKSRPDAADFNMAMDEALLEAMPRLGTPAVRVYAWAEPAASFGYFQKYQDVARMTPLRPLVRRPTGGGLVPHDRDWTYSVAIPPSHEWYSIAARESYQRIHTWVQSALTQIQVESRLAMDPFKPELGKCFVGFEQFDLLWNSTKIAGAAQRRRRDGLLIQGSLQPPLLTMVREDWEQSMRSAGTQQFGIQWVTWTPDEGLATRAEILRQRKYTRMEYNQRR